MTPSETTPPPTSATVPEPAAPRRTRRGTFTNGAWDENPEGPTLAAMTEDRRGPGRPPRTPAAETTAPVPPEAQVGPAEQALGDPAAAKSATPAQPAGQPDAVEVAPVEVAAVQPSAAEPTSDLPGSAEKPAADSAAGTDAPEAARTAPKHAAETPSGTPRHAAETASTTPRLRPAAVGRIVSTAGGTAVRAAASGSRTAVRAARRPPGRLLLGGLLIAVVVGLTVGLGGFLVSNSDAKSRTHAQATESAAAQPSSTEGAGLPSFSPPPTVAASPVAANAGLTGWAEQLAVKVEIPPVALRAYAYAEWVLGQRTPTCKLSWTTIAAIGKIESNHGRVGAATLGSDGRVLPPLVGPALDGKGGRAKVTDTDAGALDDDRAWDHTVGPMQFLPATWRSYAVDADGDGIVDPNDIDDAALAAANKLCESGKDLTQPANWSAAIKTFPDLTAKVQQVFDAANTYGQKSRA